MLMMRQGPISPYVIQLYEWFEHPQVFTLIMENPDPCESLFDFINNNPNMNEKTAQFIMCQAVQAVQHCIERGVFHNDIHPENILLRKHTLELKLIDFGCGQLLSSNGYDCRQYRGELAFCVTECGNQYLVTYYWTCDASKNCSTLNMSCLQEYRLTSHLNSSSVAKSTPSL